jgi:hypothetical protein
VIVVAAFRFMHDVWVEARQLQRKMLRGNEH